MKVGRRHVRCYFGLVAVPAMVGKSDMMGGDGAVCGGVIANRR
jgi:hypothetical protein